MNQSYRDLVVWQKAMELAVQVYEVTKQFPVDERFGLVSQMRRSAVSVPSNIAEGQSRLTSGEFLQFLGIARGSIAELSTQVILAERLGYLPAAPPNLKPDRRSRSHAHWPNQIPPNQN